MFSKFNLKLVFILSIFSQLIFAQDNTITTPERYTAHNKGKFYIFWGGNRDYYTKSDIRFQGSNYDFTVNDAIADDKPKGYHIDYVNPGRMTIPQTNFRIGYFINDHYNISIGLDHMKYVMRQNQVANVTGYINLPNDPANYNDDYNNTPVDFYENFVEDDLGTLPSFLTFEHTDGLNYINTEFSRVDDFSKLFGIKNTDKVQINLTEGIGGGILYPKTNARVLGKPRHDDFNVAGYGISAKAGLNFTFFKYFFLQTELKGGYINMPNIKTTSESLDKASQHFMFLETVVAFGGIFRI
jgi:hypothetical protein